MSEFREDYKPYLGTKFQIKGTGDIFQIQDQINSEGKMIVNWDSDAEYPIDNVMQHFASGDWVPYESPYIQFDPVWVDKFWDKLNKQERHCMDCFGGKCAKEVFVRRTLNKMVPW